MRNHITKPNPITLDVLVLLIVTPAAIQGQDAFIIVFALLAYLLLGLWLPLAQNPNDSTKQNRFSFIFRYTIILILATSAVVSPTLLNIYERIVTPIEADGYSPAYLDLSDSAMQTELALDYLAEGKNPYVERYEETPLRFYQWVNPGLEDWQDPAYDYFVYLPGTILLSLPFYKLIPAFNIAYDQRIVYLLAYILLLLILPHLVKPPAYKLALVAAVGLNPLFTEPVMLGMNDVAPFLALVISILALTHRKFLWAALFMGIACALKQYAWFIGPFYILYVWEQSPADKKTRNFLLTGGIVATILILTSLPFLLWDPIAFYTDTLAFPAGRAELLYPIRGFTVGRLLMGAGIIPTFVSPFPFQLLQLILGLPILLLLLRFQYRRDLGTMLLCAAIFIFVFGIFSRFFHHNYVGIVITLAALGIMLSFADRENVHLQLDSAGQ